MSEAGTTAVTLLRREVEIDFGPLFAALLDLAWQTLTHDPADALEQIMTRVLPERGMFGSLERTQHQVAALVGRAAHRAILDLVVQHIHLFTDPVAHRSADDCSARSGADVNDVRVVFDLASVSFAEPERTPFVSALQGRLKAWLAWRGLTDTVAETVSTRLGQYYAAALSCEWSDDKADDPDVARFLVLVSVPVQWRYPGWREHLALIKRSPHEPLLGECFSLAQIYQPPRAWCSEPGSSRVVVDAMTSLNDWWARREPQDRPRVITGGPGRGKSALATMFAAHVVEAGGFVLAVDFLRFRLERDVFEAIATYAAGEGLPRGVDPEWTLLIFDNIDDALDRGLLTYGALIRFVKDLDTFICRPGSAMALLVARDRTIAALGDALLPDHCCLEIIPYGLVASEPLRDAEPSDLLAIDQRVNWWQAYGRLTGRDDGIPARLAHRAPSTVEPLNNHLIARAFVEGQIGPDASRVSPSDAYAALVVRAQPRLSELDRISRRRDEGVSHDPAPTAPADFESLLRSVAVMQWQNRGRERPRDFGGPSAHASLDRIARLRSGLDPVTHWLVASLGCAGADDAVPGWRSSYSIPRGLSEYLVASEIVLFLEDIQAESTRHAGNSRRGWSPTEQLHRWVGLFGPAPLSADIVHQVLDILRQRARHPRDELAYACREPLARLIGVVLTHDFPRAAMPPGKSLADCLAWSRNAGEALLVLTSACAEVSGARARIEEPAPGSFGNWLRRLQPQRVGRETSLSLAHLRRLDLSEVRLPLADLHGANFKQTDLSDAVLDGANLEKANLTQASLTHADLIGGCLKGAVMRKGNLTEARLDEVNAEGIDLTEARLVQADFSRARLAGARLVGADLTSANLSNADLSHADLSRAKCADADFSGADLTGANLTMADLKGADFSDATLLSANLHWTNLAEASCNMATRWPAGFDHRRAGVEES